MSFGLTQNIDKKVRKRMFRAGFQLNGNEDSAAATAPSGAVTSESR
jgi:hypothetical protein